MRLLPGFLSRNWQLKLSAFALAVLLWTVPRFEAPARQTLEDVPVRVQLNDPEWALRGDPLPSTVEVTLSGPARELFALSVDRPSVLVPVDRVLSQDTAVLIRFQWVRIPDREGVVVESVEPSAVRLTFEPIEVAAVPIRPVLTGSLREGLALADPPAVSPVFVRVSGPASRVAALDSLSLVPLDLSRIRSSGGYRAPVDTSGLGSLALSPREAVVTLRIEEAGERRIPDVPVLALPPAAMDVEVQPSSVTLILVGAPSRLSAVDPSRLLVVPDPSSVVTLARGEERRVSLQVEGVPDLVEVRVTPEFVTVRRPSRR